MTESFEHPSGTELIRRYFHQIRLIIFSPRLFFRQMPVSGGVSGPLAFALVTHWFATMVAHFWRGIWGERFFSIWSKLFASLFNGPEHSIDSIGRLPWYSSSRSALMDWFWSAGPVIADPFLTLIKLLLLSFVLFFGAKLLVPDRSGNAPKASYEITLRVLAYAMTANLISVVPIIGSSLVLFFQFVLVVLGLYEVFQIGFLRALVITLFPIILVIGTIVIATLGSFGVIIGILMNV